jgi:isopenicillin N synthase-like dioxygenase
VSQAEEKLKYHVKHGGLAWRGYMPLGGESTHGKRDEKEGL